MPEFDKVLQEIKEQLIQKFHPSKVILFGSVEKGIFKETSDIDLCVVQDTVAFAYQINNTGVTIYG